jgi:hypothetical protein
MLHRTYYFIEVDKFSIPENGFFTAQQNTLPGSGVDPEPISSLKLINKDYYRGWWLLEGIHETVERKPRRLHGDPEYVNQSITGGDKPFDVFYIPDEKILLFRASKHKTKGIIRRLIKYYPNHISYKKGEVDFVKLLDKLQNSKIIGSWFSNLKGQVTSVGLFGDRVNLDDKFNYYKAVGTMSALTIEIYIKNQKEPTTIMITRERGVVIYDNWNQKEDLDFLMDIKPLLFLK